MGSYYFIEIFRQIFPAENSSVFDNMNFFAFADFDGIYANPMEGPIASLKQRYEIRHDGPIESNDLSVGTCFLSSDRQPIFLYSHDNYVNEGFEVFKISDAFKTHPIVLTLFQLDKEKIKHTKVEDLISSCDIFIRQYKNSLDICNGCKLYEPGSNECSKLVFKVFFNLGEADLAVVFRSKYLHCIARLLENIRNRAVLNDVPILSLSSYFGFPRTADWENNIKTWLINEFEITNPDFQMNILYDIPAGKTLHEKDPWFVFGEWDYVKYWDNTSICKSADMIINDLKQHWESDSIISNHYDNEKKSNWRRSSYIMAVYKQSTIFHDKDNSLDNNIVKTDIYATLLKIRNMNTTLNNAFVDLNNKFASTCSILGYEQIKKATEMLTSLRRTICGLISFLARLYSGRYEQDMYQYISPVFYRLAKIIKSYFELINKSLEITNDEDRINVISNLIHECIRDTGELITRLQQIYTVLGVSPHTFMETYGSSMRSLAASSKLIGAYQGMLKYIENKFPVNGNIEAYAVLITPYRQTQPNNNLLYALSKPSNRIISIQVDYTKLFKGNTVFMLLHECAHTMTDRLRKHRFKYFAEAWVNLLFYQSYGYWYTAPIDALYKNVTNDNQNRPVNIIFKSINDINNKNIDVKNKLVNIIRFDISECINKSCKEMADVLSEKYDNDVISDLKYHMREVDAWIRKRIKDDDVKNKKDTEKLIYRIFISCAANIQKKIYKRIKEIKNYLTISKGNVREAIRLESLYSRSDSNEQLINAFPETLNKMLTDPYNLTLLPNVFQDVYADLFAIMVLNKKMCVETYIDALVEFFGTNTVKLLTDNDYFYLRFITIAEVMGWKFRLDTDDAKTSFIEIFISKQTIPDNLANKIRDDWRRLYELPYRQPILEYAKKCKEYLETNVKSIEEEAELKAIRLLWENMDINTPEAIENTVQNIYTLWLYLMNNCKEAGEGNGSKSA